METRAPGPGCAAGRWCSGGWSTSPARGDSCRDSIRQRRLRLARTAPAGRLLALLIGLPIALVLAWYHGDRGQQRVTRSEFAILTLLLLLGGGVFWYYQRTSETATVATPPPPSRARLRDRCSIAVLPFVNMSADKEQEYFADGISEELLNLLAQVPELRVIARTSSFSFKGKDVDIAEIARRLNVANVLEGSVRKSGDTLRITAQLVRASDSSHLWSQTYDRQMTDVFKVQDEIAAAVVAQLKIKLLGAAPKATDTDPRAYALFLQAREIGRATVDRGITSRRSRCTSRRSRSIPPMRRRGSAWPIPTATRWISAHFGRSRAIPLARDATSAGADASTQTTRRRTHAWRWIEGIFRGDLAAAAQSTSSTRLALEPTNLDSLRRSRHDRRRLGDSSRRRTRRVPGRARPGEVYSHEQLGITYLYVGRLDDAVAAVIARRSS